MAQIKSGALVAATVASVTLTGSVGKFSVTNRDAALEIWFTSNGAAPTVAGDDCQLAPPGKTVISLYGGALVSGNSVIKLISSGTPSYTVGAVDA